eukprot:symbB.v1.2.001236.t1/scaffold63.1/size477159/7
MARDGQEIEKGVGRKVCSIIDKHIDDPESFPQVQTWHLSETKRRKSHHAPHPLEDGFDKQVDFFLNMQYEDYVEWWKHYGASSPGPAPPP